MNIIYSAIAATQVQTELGAQKYGYGHGYFAAVTWLLFPHSSGPDCSYSTVIALRGSLMIPPSPLCPSPRRLRQLGPKPVLCSPVPNFSPVRPMTTKLIPPPPAQYTRLRGCTLTPITITYPLLRAIPEINAWEGEGDGNL